MALILDSQAEAYASVALLVAGADGVGTTDERKFLFDVLRDNYAPFADYDLEAIGELLGRVAGRMFGELPNNGAQFDISAIDSICSAVLKKVSETDRSEIFEMALKVACCDGLEKTEHALLLRIGENLGIAEDVAQQAIAQA